MRTALASSKPESCPRIPRKYAETSSGEVSPLNRSRFHTVCRICGAVRRSQDPEPSVETLNPVVASDAVLTK
jgi:hypothetical protein